MHTTALEAIPKSRAFRIEVCESLSRSPFFQGLVVGRTRHPEFPTAGYRANVGDTLFNEGDPGDAMGLLLSGQIEVRKTTRRA